MNDNNKAIVTEHLLIDALLTDNLTWDMFGGVRHIERNVGTFAKMGEDKKLRVAQFIGQMPCIDQAYLEMAATALYKQFLPPSSTGLPHPRNVHSSLQVWLGYKQPYNRFFVDKEVATRDLTHREWMKKIVQYIPVHRDVFLEMVQLKIPLPFEFLLIRHQLKAPPVSTAQVSTNPLAVDPVHRREGISHWIDAVASPWFALLNPDVKVAWGMFPPYKFYTDRKTKTKVFRVYNILKTLGGNGKVVLQVATPEYPSQLEKNPDMDKTKRLMIPFCTKEEGEIDIVPVKKYYSINTIKTYDGNPEMESKFLLPLGWFSFRPSLSVVQ